MRTFTIRKGKYAGEHLIFDSIEEAVKNGIKNIKTPWHRDDVEPGDWVTSDDGFVIQCLNRNRLVNKRHKSGQYTDYWRFPNGTFYVYVNKNGEKSIKNFYAVAAMNSKSSLGNTSKLGKYMTSRKKYFVTLLSQGFSPFMAYAKAYNKSTQGHTAFIQVNKLLNDPLVKEEIKMALSPFIEKVERRIKEKTGYENLNEFLAAQLSELISDEDVSVKDKRANLQLAIQLFGDKLGITEPKKLGKGSDAEEAEYHLVEPPQLGLSKEELNVSSTPDKHSTISLSNRTTDLRIQYAS